MTKITSGIVKEPIWLTLALSKTDIKKAPVRASTSPKGREPNAVVDDQKSGAPITASVSVKASQIRSRLLEEEVLDKAIDKETATDVSGRILDAFNSLESATRMIHEKCSKSEFEGFRSEAGKVAGGLYRLLEPLWRAYPGLAPEGSAMSPPKGKGKR